MWTAVAAVRDANDGMVARGRVGIQVRCLSESMYGVCLSLLRSIIASSFPNVLWRGDAR